MRKLESMWWHESPQNGKLASSHIAVLFCALARNNMIAPSLMKLEFEGTSGALDDESLSPLDYLLAYTDGELYDDYIRPTYRKVISDLYDSGGIMEIFFTLDGLEHTGRSDAYTLTCTWHNVEVLRGWLQEQF